MGISRARRMPSGLLTGWGDTATRRVSRGATFGDSQPVSGKLRRKLGVSPGFAAYSGPPPPKPLSTLAEGAHGGAVRYSSNMQRRRFLQTLPAAAAAMTAAASAEEVTGKLGFHTYS